jgi:branched-chain amino acid transport system ATP-binding protein
MLEVQGIHTFYGRSHILQGVSLQVEAGEIVCLLGRNGVGKTTTLKSIMGLTPPRQGSIKYQGRELGGVKAHQVARLGISYVPEERRIFPQLSVRENLIMGTKSARKLSAEAIGLNLDRAYEYFPILKNKQNDPGSSLSGGQQQMLAVARGLMGNPRLMLLDEPCEGLAPIVVKELMRIVTRLSREEGLTILLVEQNARVAIKASDRGYVLEKGTVKCQGDRSFLSQSQEVRDRCGL